MITAHLVDLIQHHQWIFYSRMAETIGNPSRHGTYVCTSVTADLRFIVNASQTDAYIFFLQCMGNRPGNGSLTCSRRSYQTENRTFFGIHHLPDSQKLQNPLFHLLQTIMFFFQNFFRFSKIKPVLAPLIPRQRQQCLDISADHTCFRRIGTAVQKTLNLFLDPLLNFL